MNYLLFMRLQRQISQRDLAMKLGVQQSVLSKLENGWLTRAPGNLERKLKRFFGPEWTFQRLMERVPDITQNSGQGAA